MILYIVVCVKINREYFANIVCPSANPLSPSGLRLLCPFSRARHRLECTQAGPDAFAKARPSDPGPRRRRPASWDGADERSVPHESNLSERTLRGQIRVRRGVRRRGLPASRPPARPCPWLRLRQCPRSPLAACGLRLRRNRLRLPGGQLRTGVRLLPAHDLLLPSGPRARPPAAPCRGGLLLQTELPGGAVPAVRPADLQPAGL